MTTRMMTIGDHEAMSALWRGTDGMGLSAADSKENIGRFLARNEGLCFVAERRGELIGTVMCGHDGRRGYIYHAAVDESYRGQGIGTTLIEKSLRALKDAGIEKCHLFVFEDNNDGRAYWEAAGWRLRGDLAVYSKNL